MGHGEQVAAAMSAFFAQQFSADPNAYGTVNPNEYNPEKSEYKPRLEYLEDPFGEGIKNPPGKLF